MEYGEKIAALRKSKGLTQAELGAELNVTYQAVSKWERGESLPDFATMSKISKLFGVPLEYFDEGELPAEKETAAAAVAPTVEGPKMLGVCKECGRVVNEGEEFSTEPTLVCKKCHEAKIAEAEKKKREEAEKARRAAAYEKADAKRKLNVGLILGGVAGGALLIFLIICGIVAGNKEEAGYYAIGSIILIIIGFTFTAQMFWGGVVRSMFCEGGVLIGTPGVIFSLDLDGIIFLIGIKILFAVLKMLLLVLTTLLFAFVAVVISPFTFVPSLIINVRNAR